MNRFECSMSTEPVKIATLQHMAISGGRGASMRDDEPPTPQFIGWATFEKIHN